MPDKRPRKVQRASRACDFCHKRSIRCKPSQEDAERCQNCVDFDIACTYTRPWKRARTSVAGSELATERAQGWGAEPIRQTKDNKSNNASAVEDAEGQQSDPDAAYSGRLAKQYRRHVDEPLGQAWRAFAVASESTIWALLNAYHRVVYPIFPLFHHETLLKRLRNHDHLKDRGFFACVMAACALASARGRDGALAAWQADSAQSVPVPSETFYAAARDAIPKDTHCANEFEYLRACALLAIVSIQYGKIDAVHEHLGNYFTLSATQRFYDEPQWPAHLSRVEREERRRLFWSTYTLDVYSSIVWSGQMRSREAHVQVPYPSEADDDKLETSAIGLVDPSCWLHGWNFTTDLYRVLEHTVDKLRSRHAFSGPLRPMQAAFATDSFSGPVVLQSVLDVYARLPSRFKTIPSVTGEQAHDIFGFQAANIQATLQLLRIVLFSAEENVDMDQKCNVAADLLSVFHNAPVAYLKAISTPLIYHLGGIGTILGSVMEGPLSETSYYRVRGMLLSMADLLEHLESGLHHTAGISRGLRAQVDRIDEYMSLQRTKARDSKLLQPHAMVSAETAIGANTLPNLSAAAAPPGNALPPLNGIQGYSEYSPTEIQLPPELLEDWPWPFELNGQEFGFSWPGVDPSGWEITV